MKFWRALFSISVGLLFPFFAIANTPPNVLWIIADDLNNHLGCYSHNEVKTPNLDRLAARGIRFDRAYVQYPMCNPSRVSILSSLYPYKTKVLDNSTPTRAFLKDTVFLPELFRKGGYQTAKLGKIFHTGAGYEDPRSWDFDLVEPLTAKTPRASQILSQSGDNVVLNCKDSSTYAGFLARVTVKKFRELSLAPKPFLLAVGFRAPHVPYIAHKKYYDLYAREKINLPVQPLENLKKIPLPALTYDPAHPPTRREIRDDIRGYHASISFLDAQMGMILDHLDQVNAWTNTVVIFMSDHGYHLGEHGGLLHKSSLFEEACQIPLIMSVPNSPGGKAAHGMVELIDLYPTLCELCSIPIPKGISGHSFAPLLVNPSLSAKASVFSMVCRNNTRNPNLELDPKKAGYSIRTETMRYTRWWTGEEELYDEVQDPSEGSNLALDPAWRQKKSEMLQLLKSQHPVPGI